VNLFTSQPTEQASAKLMASYGTDNDINANAVLNSGEIAPGLLSVYGGWRAPFAIYLLGAIFFLCALVTLDRRMDAVGGRPDQVGESLRPLIPLYILTYVLFLVVMMTAIQVPILLAGVGITNPATRSLMLSLGSIGSSTSGFLFGWIFRALGPRWTMVFSPALVALGFIVAGSSLDPRIVAGACLTFGFGAGMTNPYICNLMLSRAAPALRARAVGLIFVVASVAEFSNPLLIAPLQNAIGIRGAFLAVGIMVGIGAAANALIQIRRNMGS
jgi:predicted MFS family arabinose efflux permease